MVLSDISIKRPVLATVMNLLIVLLGWIAYDRLPVREYPNIDVPVVTVETKFLGASAEIIESKVTKILEDSLSGIEGIDFMSSVSRAEQSQITITFNLDRDADNAAADVRDRVSRVRGQLPDDVDEPVIAKVEADAQPVIWLAFSSDRHPALDVSDVATHQVKDRLSTLPGVSGLRVVGERRYAMRVWLDRARLAAYSMTPQDVEDALTQQNLEVPSGRIESEQREFTVLAETDLKTPAQFENVILRNVGGYLVRLGDVAKVELGPLDERTIARFKGENAVALGVIKQSTASLLSVAQRVHEEVPKLSENLPEGMKVQVAYDSSIFVQRSIEAVRETILIATGLVLIVIFVFLRSFRATLIPLVTIPVSLIGAFAIMYALGFTINTLTLLALVLAIGLVVDDAIVMLENIHRHIEEGMPPMQAAFKGSREIGFAVVAMTLTLAAVYIPLTFSTGRVGKLFIEFALTLAGAVLVSGFIALSLSPMMSSRMLRHQKKHNELYLLSEAALKGLTNGYRKLLALSLKARPIVLLLALATGFSAYAAFNGWPGPVNGWIKALNSSYAGFTGLKSELSPLEDRGLVVSGGVAPEGATPEYVDRYARKIEGFVTNGIPELWYYFTIVGFPTTTNAFVFTRLKDWKERSRSQQSYTAEMMPKLFGGIPGILAFATNPPSLGQSAITKQLEVVVQITGSFAELDSIISQVMAKARANPGLAGLDTDLKLNKPELKVAVNRDKVAAVGANVAAIGHTLETMLGGRQVTRFKRGSDQYDVMVQVAGVDRRNPADVTNIYVRGGKDEMIQLGNLLDVREAVAPKELNHFSKLRAATISSNLGSGYSLGEALQFLEQTIREIAPSAIIDYKGNAREFKSSAATLYVTFLLALGFIFLVLAAQFESWIDPLIIMFTVPLAMAGALWALILFCPGGSMNVYSKIGLITLVGLITKHGILIVEFANQLQERGRDKVQAVIEAATLRLRPILMTTGAMVLGAVPLARAVGAGAESRQQIGWVIVGGMTLGTVLTLFVVPTVTLCSLVGASPCPRPPLSMSRRRMSQQRGASRIKRRRRDPAPA
ncbi:MAG: efflux RND transporter permease subunit [Gammaproteobacteria bacterium]